MGKRTQVNALHSLLAEGESALWSGVLVEIIPLKDDPIKMKVRALLTENAMIWIPLRDLITPIRVEFREMIKPQIFLTGMVGHFSFLTDPADVSSEWVTTHVNVSQGITFAGVPGPFIECLVNQIPILQVLSPLLRQRYT